MPKKAVVKKTARTKSRGSIGPARSRGGKKTVGRAGSKKARGPKTAAPGPEGAIPTNVDGIRQLVELMVENDLNEVDIAHGKTKILIRRGGAVSAAGAEPPAAAAAPQAAAEAPAQQELVGEKNYRIVFPYR